MKIVGGYGTTNGVEISKRIKIAVLCFIPKAHRKYFARIEGKEENDTNIYKLYQSTEGHLATAREFMEDAYRRIKSLDNGQNIENIKFHIKLPLGRSMMSVLEKLREEGIEFYIPPLDIKGLSTKKSEPFYRIYIDRKYLKQYKQKVHPIISNPKDGAVLIGNEDVKMSELLLTGTEFPFGLDKKGKQKD